jgi:DNA-directed RNA polymerase subunit RPC12/RpoP
MNLPPETQAMVQRRHRASEQKIVCPECGTRQVQLCRWYSPVCHFRCRECGKRFTADVS